MERVNEKLKEYIESEILPIYKNNDSGHDIEHIKYVTCRSFKLSRYFENINLDMVYTIACFHDLAHHINKDKHEILSAKLFYENEKMKEFFNDEQRKIIKEAIEDHRASLEYEPRSDYGKIISSADRNIDIVSTLKRTHFYTKRHFPNSNLEQMIDRAYNHISKKFGKYGYAKFYVEDEEYNKFREDVLILLANRLVFAKKYMEVNNIMDVKEKAKTYAIEAHRGQVRKGEPDKPMIIHPISVGMLLEEYGYDDNVIAAGYLHDVVEDTKCSIEDIKEYFGNDIATLVRGASEPDKSLSWEERKQHTIEETKKLPLRNKLVICADKINNLEDLMINFQKSGRRDFSAFKRGENQQKWYYTSVYYSLIYGENPNLPIFVRLKEVLDIVFYNKEDLYLKDTIFNNSEYYKKLKKLHARKVELQRLKSLCSLKKPFVIEFTGTPRTGKTSIINNLYDFFKKGGFNVSVIEEFTTSKYYKENLKSDFEKMNSTDKYMAILQKVYEQLLDRINSKSDIILIDRSINDRQIWNYSCYIHGNISEDNYLEVRDKFSNISSELIDFLVVTYVDSLTCLKRDYNCSLALEKRRFLNIENVGEYNNSLFKLHNLLTKSVGNILLLDTSESTINDDAIYIATKIMTAMRKEYIKSFKEMYKL